MAKRIIPILLVSFVLLACTCSLPAIPLEATAIPSAAAIGTAPAVATVTLPVPDAEPSPAVPSPITDPGFTEVRLLPEDGSLLDLLREHAGKALLLGQKPFIEFDASW
jgi:hypothetical protein